MICRFSGKWHVCGLLLTNRKMRWCGSEIATQLQNLMDKRTVKLSLCQTKFRCDLQMIVSDLSCVASRRLANEDHRMVACSTARCNYIFLKLIFIIGGWN